MSSNNEDTINFLLKTDKKFLYQTSVVITSILETHNAHNVHIHVMHRDLLNEDLQHISQFIQQYNQQISYYKIKSELFEQFPIKERYGKEVVYYDMIAHYVLPKNISKVIFLGGDALAFKPLDKYYNVDLKNHFMLFCIIDLSCKSKNIVLGESVDNQGAYAPFDSYVLNLDYLREQNITLEDYVQCLKNSKMNPVFADMNLKVEMFCPKGKSLFCDARKFDFTMNYLMKDEKTIEEIDPYVVHYVEIKPWDFWDPDDVDDCQLMWNHQRCSNNWIRNNYSNIPYGFDDERFLNSIYYIMKKWWRYAKLSPYSNELLKIADMNKSKIFSLKDKYDLLSEQKSKVKQKELANIIYELRYDTALNITGKKLIQRNSDYRVRVYSTPLNSEQSFDCLIIPICLKSNEKYVLKAVIKLHSDYKGNINIWCGNKKYYEQRIYSTWIGTTNEHTVSINVNQQIELKQDANFISIPTKYVCGRGSYLEFVFFDVYKVK